MTVILTSTQMRALENAAIASGAVPGLELMERAGQGVVAAVFDMWPDFAAQSGRAVILCGPGNNGGDGFVVARLLKAHGWDVDVFLLGEPGHLPIDAKVNFDKWQRLGRTENLTAGCIEGPFDLLVDAIFGTGLTRPMEIDIAGLFKDGTLAMHAGDSKTVSVDIPSGLCADSGRVLGRVVPADLTVSFQTAKPGHHLAEGPELCGARIVRGIGLEGWMQEAVRDETLTALPVHLIDGPSGDLNKRDGHKFSHGHALVVSGGAGRTGAARLAARGALRIGAGLVTLGVPPNAQMEVAQQITAIMLRRFSDVDTLTAALSDTRITALCIGPGLGLDTRAAGQIEAVLNAGKPTVLDADALTLIAQNKRLFDLLHEDCVLTPHGGEFARLFPDLTARLEEVPATGPAYSKVDATREAANRVGCAVLFKGPDTVIAEPNGRCSINPPDPRAAWLATAGSGDVLAGFICGLLARGFSSFSAASTAAYLHTECARSFGAGLIAEDLPEELPAVFRALTL